MLLKKVIFQKVSVYVINENVCSENKHEFYTVLIVLQNMTVPN